MEAKGLRVFVPDLSGFGQNPAPSVGWSIDDYVEWVKEYAARNSLDRFFLLGHSFGGGVAAKFAAKYPEKIEKLFLVASAIVRRKTFKKELFKKISVFFPKLSFLRKIFYKIFFLKSDYLYTTGVMKETYLKIVKEDLLRYLSEISLPAIIIWGDKDDITPLPDAYLIKKEIKNSKLEILPGIGHRVNFEAPEILVQKILENI